MLAAFILILLILQPSGATVNCPTACRKCRENREHFAVLEVYCAMCQECRERRREWMYDVPARRSGSVENAPKNYEDYQEECPTQPTCEYEDKRIVLKSTVYTTTTTTTTTTPSTTTKRPCPPIQGCKKRLRRPKQSCCVPICPYESHCPTGVTIQKLMTADTIPFTSRTTIPDYFYVDVGVPKALLNSV